MILSVGHYCGVLQYSDQMTSKVRKKYFENVQLNMLKLNRHEKNNMIEYDWNDSLDNWEKID
jgi:hypothetical protein